MGVIEGDARSLDYSSLKTRLVFRNMPSFSLPCFAHYAGAHSQDSRLRR